MNANEVAEIRSDENAACAERRQRVADAIALSTPDRVPYYLSGRFWTTRQAGMTCQQAMYDAKGVSGAMRAAIMEFEPDLYQLPHPQVTMGLPLEILDFEGLAWPGHGVGEDLPYQYLDRENMSPAEYDELLFDPTGFMLRTYYPRIAGALRGLARLPDFFAHYYTRIQGVARGFADPEVKASIDALVAAGQEVEAVRKEAKKFANEMEELGYPLFVGAITSAPFDMLSDFFRGSKGAMLDMYRHHDKLLEVTEKMTRMIVRDAVATARDNPGSHVFMPLHWGLDGFMSPEQFNTFYWPPLRTVILALIDAGLVPYIFWEGDCGSRLEAIADIPPGKAIYKFERTDLFRAKEILGDIVCLQGNVPASMLSTGSPDEVDAYCRKLVEVVGKDGGFILDGAVGVPDEARKENVTAMMQAARKYSA